MPMWRLLYLSRMVNSPEVNSWIWYYALPSPDWVDATWRIVATGDFFGARLTCMSPAPSRASRAEYLDLRETPSLATSGLVTLTGPSPRRPDSKWIARATARGALPRKLAALSSQAIGIGPRRNCPVTR